MSKNNKTTPIYVRIDNKYLELVDDKIEQKVYGNRGHAINFALKRLFEFDKRELL